MRAVIGPGEAIGDGPSPLTGEPQFAGAPIAAVAAETLDQARAALALLAPALDALPFAVDIEEAPARAALHQRAERARARRAGVVRLG